MMVRAGNYVETFPNNKFRGNCNKIFRYDCNRSENYLDLHISANIPWKLLQQHELFLSFEIIAIKVKN